MVTSTGTRIDPLPPRELLGELAQQRLQEHLAGAEQLRLAAEWARGHQPGGAYLAGRGAPPFPLTTRDGIITDGREEFIELAADGIPPVAEFAVLELSAALGLSSLAGRCLVGEALELTERLPQVWSRVRGGQLPPWRARRIAQRTVVESAEVAAAVDAAVAGRAHQIGTTALDRLVEPILARLDPEAAAERAATAADRRRVAVAPTQPDGTAEVFMLLDGPDAHALDATIGRIAERLAAGGDARPLGQRRARAVGVLADPQAALDLLTASPGGHPLPPTRAELALYVHLRAGAAGLEGLAEVEGVGTLALQTVRSWVGSAHRVSVRPVLDLAEPISEQQYRPSRRLAEQVVLAHARCVFPFCTRRSRACELDHNPEYQTAYHQSTYYQSTYYQSTYYQSAEQPGAEQPEPPPPTATRGRTSSDTLAPLCRHHHRARTHARWRYRRDAGGCYAWTSPLGLHYAVDEDGTIPLD